MQLKEKEIFGIYRYTDIQIHRYKNIQLNICTDIQRHRHTSKDIYIYINHFHQSDRLKLFLA